jgi:protein-S-isoprenylcysteine O-methyltransferase Ste14
MFEFLRNNVFAVGYFNWWLVAIYIVLVGVFLYGILQPRRKSEWKSAGMAQAWVIALYAEMYGTPLTAYLMMGAVGRSTADAEKHFNGHMWPMFFGLEESSMVTAQFVTALLGQTLIVIGALIALLGWRQLYSAVKKQEMAQSGLYRYVRHPQYTGFFLFLIGSVINWPTLATVITLPVLCFVYLRLANSEEAESQERFGEQYQRYVAKTGKFLPRLISA